MSTIKRSAAQSTRSSSSTRSQASKKPQQSSRAQKPAENRKPRADEFKPSEETRDGGRTRGSRRNGETDRTRESRKPEDANKPKDPNKPEDGTKPEEARPLDDRLKDIEKQLEELRNKKEEAPPTEAPQQSGGCCGGGKKGGDEKAEDAQGVKDKDQKGPDGELQALASQVLQASGGLGGNPQAGGKAVPGGVQGPGGAAGNPQQAKSQLAQKASQYAKQGFQPQPTTRILVQAALGFDAFQQQGQGQANPFGQNLPGLATGQPGAPAGVAGLGQQPLPNLGMARF